MAIVCYKVFFQVLLPCITHLQKTRQCLPSAECKANEDAGLMARGILVNIGLLDIDLLHGPEAYEEGLKLNKGRRKTRPTP